MRLVYFIININIGVLFKITLLNVRLKVGQAKEYIGLKVIDKLAELNYKNTQNNKGQECNDHNIIPKAYGEVIRS